ncbi:MAG TPA: alkaline phosphatase family protein [Candidatus Cybelea sp.]|nr:alkaline phosphatase family protein [Candidatus Cybelea sp.]
MAHRAGIAVWAIVAVTLAGCGALPLGLSKGQGDKAGGQNESSSSPISHIVLIVQENRSFDNFFATYPGADGTMTGKMKNKTIKLREASLDQMCDFGHSRNDFLHAYDHGKMNGFYLESQTTGCPKRAGAAPYEYVNPQQIAPYWDIAEQYVLADHMFQTQGSGSFTAHQDLIRGGTTIDQAQTESIVDVPDGEPWGCDASPGTLTSYLSGKPGHLEYRFKKGPFPCTSDFPASGSYYATLRDLLDAQSVSWKYYVPPLTERQSGNLWNAFDVIAPVRYGKEWNDNVSMPETNIFNDISGGTLASMSWVIPDLKDSDHPSNGSDTGPSWVASLVNAIGESSYWQTTAIVIVWDDWGGFYDHVPPPFLDDWGGLGFRVPMLVVSPYARETSSQPGYIAHTSYEFGSILKFIEGTWSLGSLGTTDQRATSIANCFDFTQQPRKFSAIPSLYSRAYFERRKPSYQPVDTQ